MVLKSLAVILLTAGSAIAQTNFGLVLDSPCYSTRAVAEQLNDLYGADPLLTGHGTVLTYASATELVLVEGYFTLWTNQDTGFFVTTLTADGLTCILITGTDFEPFSQ